MIQLLLFLAVLALAFVLGMLAGHRQAFPFGLLLRLKHRLQFLRSGVGPASEQVPEFVLTMDSPEALEQKRQNLARFIWGAAGLPLDRLPDSLSEAADIPLARLFSSHASAQAWSVRMDHGVDSRVLVLTPSRLTQATAVIYQQGHEGSAWAGRRVIGKLLERGHRVVVLEMPLLGANSQPLVHLRRHGQVRFQDHDYFSLLDHEFGGNSIRFFVEPVIACINQLAVGGVEKFAMLGWSGGGWTTTLCAALDRRISRSFSVAGSLPFSLRRRGELSDYENHLPALYDLANYPELYVLSAHGPGRVAMQILNEFDPVAWSGRRGLLYEQCVQQALSRLGEGHFQCLIDSTWVGHGISNYALNEIFLRLN